MGICKLVTISFLVIIVLPVFSQNAGTSLVGVIVDKDSKTPVEFANIELLKPSDSSVITGMVTDAKGPFTIDQLKPGIYLLRYSFIGFEKTVMLVTVTGKPRMNLGTIEIILLSKPISNVTVTSTKSLLNTSIDRKSYVVTKDILAQSGTESDVRKNIPSVEVDIEGNVSLRGSGDVMILINGRTSPLLGKLNKAEVLQQFPANTIERIDVITNPSARYKPDGTSDIINIILKKV